MDIIERLRSFGPDWTKKINGSIAPYEVCANAADRIESDAKVIAALREALGNCISYLESETGMTMKHPVLKIAKAAIEQTIGEH